jgi:hypothetical protein
MTPSASHVPTRVSHAGQLPGWWWIGPVVVGGLLVSGAPAILSLGGAVALAALWCRALEQPTTAEGPMTTSREA